MTEEYLRAYRDGIEAARQSIYVALTQMQHRYIDMKYAADAARDSATSEPVLATSYDEATMR